METIEEYRHVVDKRTRELFLISVKSVVERLNPKFLGFIGVINSAEKEYSHDIDVLMFPAESSKIGETIREMILFYKLLKEDIKKNHERFYVSASPRKAMQEMTYYIASLQEGGAGLIPVHSLFFPDYKSYKKLNPVGFQNSIKDKIVTIYGEFDVINKVNNDIPQEKLEPYFLVLDFEMSSKLETFPRHLIRTTAESLLSYLKSKYNLGEKKSVHNVSDIEPELNRILEELDNRTYNLP